MLKFGELFRIVLGGLAAFLLAGCQTGPSSLSPSTTTYYVHPAANASPSASAHPAASATPVTNPAPPVVLAEPPTVVPPPLQVAPTIELPLSEPASITTPPPTANALAWPSNWVNAWIALDSWCQFNGLPKPQQLTSGLEATYQLNTTNGLFILRMGSHAAQFSGMEFLFGFAPKLIRGLPYIHALDARKTLQPLLAETRTIARSNRTVVIDPGHGGKDVGARSCINGEYEKQYTLDCARRLQRRLEGSGWTVILTRTNDVYVSLADRVALADKVNADLFLSLHFNSGNGNVTLTGLETYCLTPSGMPSHLLRTDGDDPRQQHPNNAFDDQNFQLASRLHRRVLTASGSVDRGVRRARFMGVLRGQSRPAVLIEGGYLTNPTDAQRISTSEFRQGIAEGVAQALE